MVQILDCHTIIDQAVNLNNVDKEPHGTCALIYRSYFDGALFKENGLLSKQESISLILHIDVLILKYVIPLAHPEGSIKPVVCIGFWAVTLLCPPSNQNTIS